jgi:uncharacterized protein
VENNILLIDGYNVIYKIDELKSSLTISLERAREKLISIVSEWRRAHPAVECIIVFDGNSHFSNSPSTRNMGVRCIFSMVAHGADNELIKFIKNYKGLKSNITVITDDNYVRNNCHAHGASIQPAYFFTGKVEKSRQDRKRTFSDTKKMGRSSISKINQELKERFGLK